MTLDHIEGLLREAHMAGDLRMKAWCYIALGQGDADDCAMLGLDPDDDNHERAWEVCADTIAEANAANDYRPAHLDVLDTTCRPLSDK